MAKTQVGTGVDTLPSPSGITVIIVGLGIAGLTTAIECYRKGHTVIGLEKKPDTNQFGDMIGISGNGARVLAEWRNSQISEIFSDDDLCCLSTLDMYDETGTLQYAMPCDPYDPVQVHIIRRSGVLNMLYQEAFALGLDLRFGVQIDQYWETENIAGVVIGSEKITADCVIASDGIHSKARKFITGEDITLLEGGIAYRSIFRTEEIVELPGTEWLLGEIQGRDRWLTHFGNNTMVSVGTAGKGQYVTWTCVSRGRIANDCETWMQPASVAPVLEWIKHWPMREKLTAILSNTPPGHCFNHTLLTAEPLRTWVSPGGRMILIGDAAHPSLPTVGQGANQAIEDAAVVAICLELSGKRNVPLALRVTEKLRHPRTSLLQKLAIELSNHYMKADRGSNSFSGKGISQEPWIYNHDCAHHTYEEFFKAAASVTDGLPYTPTNVPAILCHNTSESSERRAVQPVPESSGVTLNFS